MFLYVYYLLFRYDIGQEEQNKKNQSIDKLCEKKKHTSHTVSTLLAPFVLKATQCQVKSSQVKSIKSKQNKTNPIIVTVLSTVLYLLLRKRGS